MIFVLPNILSAPALARVRRLAEGANFVDGARTAGSSVRHAKHNREVETESEAARAINREITQALGHNNDFQVITAPRRLSTFLVSRYTTGMRYGDHSDNAVLSGESGQRSDMSMTLFLNEPDEYDGGALTLNVDLRPESYKLPAGHCVIYPTYFLHRVEEVTRGTRLVGVAWIQSLIRDPFKRQVLIDLAISLSFFLNATPEKQRHPEYIRLEKVHNNLKRQWLEL
jgi:PKHD-type hydroxylase